MTEEYKLLGKRLQALMDVLGLNQKEFAAETGISESYISLLVTKGARKPPPSFYYSIAEHFNVDLNYLILGEGEMFRPKKEEALAAVEEVNHVDNLSLDFPIGISNKEDFFRMIELVPYFLNLMVTTADEVFVKHRDMIKYKLDEIARKRAAQKAAAQNGEELTEPGITQHSDSTL